MLGKKRTLSKMLSCSEMCCLSWQYLSSDCSSWEKKIGTFFLNEVIFTGGRDSPSSKTDMTLLNLVLQLYLQMFW